MWFKRKTGKPDRGRELGEDLLKALAHRDRLDGSWRPSGLLPGVPERSLGGAMDCLLAEGWAEPEGGDWRLTESGRERAVALLRAHRVVETYLARKEGVPADALHVEADRAEHGFTAEGINRMADELGRPRFDPHGDPIPERRAALLEGAHVTLNLAAEGTLLRIVHLEDEPEEDFRRLMELGLAVELPLKVAGREAGWTVVELAGETLRLPDRLARQVEVRELAGDEAYPEGLCRLSALRPGESGRVEFLSSACMGPERRRLLDFGLVPGSEIRCEFSSPFGSPVAYSLRGSNLGLRREQARHVFITRIP